MVTFHLHELREAHEALKLAQQQLLHSEKMASLGRLVAGVAHELNNPISFVLGNVHALKKYSERMGRYIDAVRAGATVIVPCKVKGCGLYYGDMHAQQGDGEIAGHTTDVSGTIKEWS